MDNGEDIDKKMVVYEAQFASLLPSERQLFLDGVALGMGFMNVVIKDNNLADDEDRYMLDMSEIYKHARDKIQKGEKSIRYLTGNILVALYSHDILPLEDTQEDGEEWKL